MGTWAQRSPCSLPHTFLGIRRAFQIPWDITCLWSYWSSPPHRCPSGSYTSRGVVGHWSRDTCQGTRHQPRTCFPPAETGLFELAEFHHHSFQTYPGSSTADNHKGWEHVKNTNSKDSTAKEGQGIRAAAPGDGPIARSINLLFA